MSASAIHDSYEEMRNAQRDIPLGLGFRLHSFLETGADIRLGEGFRQDDAIPEVRPLFAVHAAGKTYTTSRPIKVRVFREGDLFFAESETLSVCGTGESARDAVEDLELHLVHFFDYYRRLGPDRVTGEAQRLKGLYKDLLTEDQ